jgi:predicted dehydrogenase
VVEHDTVSDGRAITKAGIVPALGYQRRRESHFRWIKAEINAGAFGRGATPRPTSAATGWVRSTRAPGATTAVMPGGVMLHIGIHYTDVLDYLIGPIKAVRGQLAQLVLPGDNPDVASLILEHENGALSTLNASWPRHRNTT